MAKAAAIVFSLVVMFVWGYSSWMNYYKWPAGEEVDLRREEEGRTLGGFITYLVSTNDAMKARGSEQSHDEYRFALFAVVAFSFTVCYMAFSGGGAIFSMQLVVSVSLFTAILHALISAAVLCLQALRSNAPGFTYDLEFYAVALYALVTGVASFVAMRNTDPMLRGRSDSTNAVMKALLVMFLVGAPLIPLPFDPLYEAFGYSLALPLAALCLLSLLFIGVTRENFRYD